MNKKTLAAFMAALFSLSLLSACAADNDNNMIEPEDVNYSPVRYNQDYNNGTYLDEDGIPDRDRDYINNDMNMDDDLYENNNVRQPGEVDTPFNMDEEEPDLDEEPSEERRD